MADDITEEYTHNESVDASWEMFQCEVNSVNLDECNEEDVERVLSFYLSHRFRWGSADQAHAVRTLYRVVKACRQRATGMECDNFGPDVENQSGFARMWISQQPRVMRGRDYDVDQYFY